MGEQERGCEYEVAKSGRSVGENERGGGGALVADCVGRVGGMSVEAWVGGFVVSIVGGW